MIKSPRCLFSQDPPAKRPRFTFSDEPNALPPPALMEAPSAPDAVEGARMKQRWGRKNGGDTRKNGSFRGKNEHNMTKHMIFVG